MGAIGEQVGGEEVPQSVWRDFVGDACARDIFLQVALDVAGADAMKLVRSAVDKKRFFHVIADFEIGANGLLSRHGDEDDAHLLPLATHRELIARQVKIAVERAELGHAQAGREEELKDSGISEQDSTFDRVMLFSERVARRGEETGELRGRDDINLPLREFGELNLLGGERLNAALTQKFQEGA